MKTPTLTRTGPANPIAFFVQTPGDPILRLTHSPEKCPGTIIAGIQTRIGEHLLRPGGLSSPFQVEPGPLCRHCGKPKGEHFGGFVYCNRVAPGTLHKQEDQQFLA